MDAAIRPKESELIKTIFFDTVRFDVEKMHISDGIITPNKAHPNIAIMSVASSIIDSPICQLVTTHHRQYE